MVLKRSKPNNKTLFINATSERVKVTNNNKLTDNNISNILNAYTEMKDIQHFAKLVSNSEIATKDYNLTVSSYVEQEDTREAVDIQALNAEIEQIVIREDKLRKEIAAIISELEGNVND
jgi:type I restriction enzyme M protein